MAQHDMDQPVCCFAYDDGKSDSTDPEVYVDYHAIDWEALQQQDEEASVQEDEEGSDREETPDASESEIPHGPRLIRDTHGHRLIAS